MNRPFVQITKKEYFLTKEDMLKIYADKTGYTLNDADCIHIDFVYALYLFNRDMNFESLFCDEFFTYISLAINF